ncbi:MAG: S8 family serine peptidase [bacterium]
MTPSQRAAVGSSAPPAPDIHDHSHAQNRFAVIPNAVRLGVSAAWRGRGVTIAIIDSGFVPHPDLSEPRNRVSAHVDVTQADRQPRTAAVPNDWDWHGTMTSVVAAGNGALSNGVYRALASEANVVLVAASEEGRVTEANIARGFEWVLAHRERYGIRVVSISLGGDRDESFKSNAVDMLAERAVAEGIVVVAAAGNSGCTREHHTVPPANAPSVITVGGLDDKNRLDSDERHLYCSSYGVTVDGVSKPEVIAPAMWVAAPILPGTEAYRRAEALSRIAAAPDYELARLAAELHADAGLPEIARSRGPAEIRFAVERALADAKIVSTHYQHVDGTSFAAPIVASIVAQMLEANPSLTPAMVKQILIATADRVPGASASRQGFGAVNANRALDFATRETHILTAAELHPPRIERGKLVFLYHDDAAASVSVAGDFNSWNSGFAPLSKDARGVWRAEIEPPVPGRYRYKFFVDGARWVEDSSHGFAEPDEYGGFNSVLIVSGASA